MNVTNMTKIIELLWDSSLTKKSVLEKLIRYKCILTKEQLFIEGDRELSEDEYTWVLSSYKQYVEEDQPLEYILWHVDFLGVSFHVTSDTLIPRPETEYMIDAVNEWLNDTPSCKTLLDIGTGCGVLWLSVLRHNPKQIEHAIMTDITQEALEIARGNHEKLFSDRDEVTPLFLQANILDDDSIRSLRSSTGKSWTPLLLVANLPYIPEKLFDDNTDISVKKREPKFAFVWWDDWLDRYRVMFDHMIEMQKTNQVACTQFLEMMTRQVEILVKEYWDIFTFEEVKTFHFNIRIVKAEWK